MDMTKTKKQLQKIHCEALKEFDDINSAVQDERTQCVADRRFYSISGAQWEGKLSDQFANKPKFEVNKICLAVMRIINEYRNNRFTADFVSKDGAKNDKLSDACDGLYRSDEQDSVADEAYDNAFEEGVGGGMGAWRLRAEYEDEYDDDNDRQRIRFEPIYDADQCVFFDLNAKRQDKRDATRCFVITSMTKDAYREEWDDEPDSWDVDFEDYSYDWNTENMVYVSEYYRVETIKRTVYIYETIDGEEEKYTDSDFEDDEDLYSMLNAINTKLVSEKKVKVRKVHKYILSGGKVLEDCGYIAGNQIPIVPFYGKRWYVDNIERCMGHVRLAKDAQRLKNMQLSKLGELSALSTVSKPIVSPEQIAGHQTQWSEDNVKNYPYLLLNPMTGPEGETIAAGPIAYTKPPEIPPAMAALLQLSEQDMSDILGNQQQGEQMQANTSGKAVELIQGKLDMQTYIYTSNMAKSMKRSGEIWLSMAREILVEDGRTMKIVNKEGESNSIEINLPSINPETSAVEYDNDLSQAKFNVSVDVGPSSSSKREATLRSIIGVMQTTSDQETMSVLTSMAMINLEGEGMSEVRPFFRMKLVKMGAVQPTEEEIKKLEEETANTPPDANQEYLKKAAENEAAKAGKAQADTTLSLAKSEQTQANTQEILAGIDRDDQEMVLKTAQAINQGNN